MPKIDVMDLRKADRVALEALRDRLVAVQRDLEALQLAGPETVDLSKYSEVFARTEVALPIPSKQIARLEALARRIKSDDHDLRGYVHARHFVRIGYYIDKAMALVRGCLWRLDRNEGVSPATIRFRADTLRFDGWFGEDSKSPNAEYCLLGRGFFRTPSADNTAEVIATWLEKHPDALVECVSTVDEFIVRKADSPPPLRYIWVTDNGESLNLHLVKEGCVPAATMQSPVPEFEVSVEAYQRFVRAVFDAEEDARKNKRGYWGTREFLSQEGNAKAQASFEAARKAMEASDKDSAIRHCREAMKASADDVYLRLNIAECLDELGCWEEASAAYDLAIGEGGWYEPYLKKARGMLRHVGKDAALAWLEGLMRKEPKSRKYPYIIGHFLEESGLPAEAIPYYELAVDIACKAHGFVFDDSFELVLDEQTLAKDNNDYADLWPTLTNIARAAYELGNIDKAFRFATMGVSIGRQLNRCKGYYSKDQVEAGDCDGRFVRARIFLLRGDKKSAKRELDLARVLAEQSGYTRWIEELAELSKQVEPEK